MSSKSKKGPVGLFPLCLAALSVVAVIMFILPQFSRTALNNDTLNLNGFKLAFGFKDVVNVPGSFYVFLPFLFGILTAAILIALPFIKALKKKAGLIYITSALLSLVCFTLMIVFLAAAKRVDAGGNIAHIYYFKNIIESSNKNILRGGFTAWFWLGTIFHLLAFAGSCLGAAKSR